MSNSDALPAQAQQTVMGPEPSTAHRSASSQTRFIVLLAAALLGAASLIPILSVRILPLIDYPNHLGRMYALVNIDHDATLSRFYSVQWHLVPNLAMDLFVPVLARLSDVFTASKIFVILTMALMASGPFAISGALFRRLSPWPLVGSLFIYNWIFMYGFTNFLFGVGVALWAIAAWIRLRQSSPVLRFLVSTGFSLLLFVSHLHALGLYGLTILCYEIWRWRADGETTDPAGKRRRFLVDAAVFTLPFLLMLPLLAVSATAGAAGITAWHFWWKADAIWFVFKNFWTPLDLALAAAMALGLAWAYRTGRLIVHPAAWYTIGASATVFVLMPFKLFGSSFCDSRLPIAMLFILTGMMRWRPADTAEIRRFCAVIGGIALLRIAVVWFVFMSFAGIYREFESSFQAMPPGSRIFTTRMADKGMRRTYADLFIHIPTLAMAERSSLETLAFTDPGKQVLITRPEYRASVPYEGLPPLIECVARNELDPSATDTPVTNLDYYRNWWRSYDYLYVLYARPGTPPPAEGLSLAYQGRSFQLYKVEPWGAHGPDRQALYRHYGAAECGDKPAKTG